MDAPIGTRAARLTMVLPSAAVSLTLRERVRAGELINLLIVRVGRERFAIDLAAVHEAVDVRTLEHISQMPPGAVGLVRWRGAAHTVWSPAGALRTALHSPDTALFIRVKQAGMVASVGVAVDDVEDLITVSGRDVRALSGVDDGEGLVIGALHVGGDIATVIDAEILARAVQAVPVAAAVEA